MSGPAEKTIARAAAGVAALTRANALLARGDRAAAARELDHAARSLAGLRESTLRPLKDLRAADRDAALLIGAMAVLVGGLAAGVPPANLPCGSTFEKLARAADLEARKLRGEAARGRTH